MTMTVDVLAERIAQVEKRMDERFDSLLREMGASSRAASTALEKAEAATDRRFEGVNEFRAALTDQASRFVTRDDLEALGAKLEGLVNRNREDVEELARKLA